MPSGSATVTAETGAGLEVTSKVITDIKSFLVDIDRQMLFFYLQSSDPTSPALEFSLEGVTTFTATISGGNWTIVVS